MFVLSREQFALHVDRSLSSPPTGRLLDIGAGDGGVTALMAPLFEHVYVTESDAIMRWRLRRLGYQ